MFIVGDPDQAIYGWRGAELRNILDFQRVFPNTRRIDLDTAYRSAAPLLEAAQRMIGDNRERLEHSLRAARKGSALAAVHHAKDATEEATFAIADVNGGCPGAYIPPQSRHTSGLGRRQPQQARFGRLAGPCRAVTMVARVRA